ncbi:MAG: hypothetical protein U9O94_06600 [Nanoarchaeota archaeon]|nr:hypothetical protein [Nanoarchaeota archaeon]
MDELSAKGREIYEKLLPSILPHYKDQFIVIDMSSEYWIGTTLTEALKDARAKFPDRRFFLAKIGSKDGALAQFS